MGELIQFAAEGDKKYEAYLAKPASMSGPAVVVIQEYWGLVGHIKDVTDRFAAEGFFAIAPDLYGGEVAEEPEEAGKMLMALNIPEANRIMGLAVDRVLEEPGASTERAGVIGFCMGGQLALYAATTNKRIGAAVDFYGIHPNAQPVLRDLDCPLLGIFAERDPMTTPAAVKALDAELTALGKPHEFVTYPADHAFFNDEGYRYDAEASTDAWERTLAFFRANLR